MLHKNRLRIFFLFLVFVTGIGITIPGKAQGLENPPQNYEVPPSTPLQIVNLSVSPEPLIGQIITLHIEIISIYDEANVTIWVVLPEGVELVSGSLEWQGSLTANQLKTHELSIRVTQEGDWRLRIGAFSTLSANDGYQDTETLHLISDFNSTNVVQGGEYRIIQPPDGMPKSTNPAKDVSVTSSSPLRGTGQVTIEGQFKFEATEIKSLGSGNLVTNDVERAKVEVWDTEATGDRLLTVMTYDPQSKKYSATMPNIDPDGTGIDPFLKFYTTDEERVEVVDDTEHLYILPFDLSPIIGSDLTDGTHTVNFTIPQIQPPQIGFTQALYIFDKTANDAYEFLQSEAPSWGEETRWVQINYPEGCIGNNNGDPCFTGQIFIPDTVGFEPDIILHEYGHFILSEYTSVSTIIDACLSIWFTHRMWESTTTSCAWSEGWANFFEMAVQNEAGYGGFNLETVETRLQNDVTGSNPATYEGVIAATLWDFFDTPASGVNENWDELADGFNNGPGGNGIWHFSITDTPVHVPVRPPLTLAEFWNAWRNERPNGACFGSVILQHHKLDDFEPFVKTLTTSASPAGGGSISVNPAPNCPGNTYAEGTNITLNANPATGFTFQQWLSDATGSVNPLSVDMNTDKDIIADFNNPTPTVTSTPIATTTPTPTVTFTPTATPTPTTCTHWDITEDFQTAPNEENPNRDSCNNLGVWEFMGSDNTSLNAKYSIPSTNFTSNPYGIHPGLNLWYGKISTGDGLFPAIVYNDNNTPVVYYPAKTLHIHPGPSHLGIIAWHNPLGTRSYVQISGGVMDDDSACGNGILWYIDKETGNLASGGINNGSSQDFSSGTGGTELGTIIIDPNDTIYLSINPNGNDYYCDNTKIDFQIDVVSAPTTPTPTPLNGPTSTELPPNYTPPPSTGTPLPTATPPTPQPTPDNSCIMNFLAAITSNQNTNKLSMPIQALKNIQGTLINLQLFHRVEDEVLSQTPQGEEYIALYYEYSPEIIQILSNNPTLREEAIEVIQMWEPNLQALVDGEGETVTISNIQVQAVQTFLNNLSAQASPELQQVIANEQIQQPLEQFIGVTMAEALVYVEDGLSETPTPTVTPSPTAAPDQIFADGFESGNFSAWDGANIDGGDLSVTTSAAYQSGFGLQARLDDTVNLKAVDFSPAKETRYRARFYFHPNSIAMNAGSAHFIFDGFNQGTGSAPLFRLELIYENGTYKLRQHVITDNNVYAKGIKIAISNDWHAVEIAWNKASATGANDGAMFLWVDGALVDVISNVDNDSAIHLLEKIYLGATGGIDPTTSGSMFFDDFISHRETFIGQ